MKTHAPYGMEITDDCATCPLRKDGFFCQMTTETLADFQKQSQRLDELLAFASAADRAKVRGGNAQRLFFG